MLFRSHLKFGTNDAIRMTILNDGNIGVGTETPGHLLTVAYSGTTQEALNVTSTGTTNSTSVVTIYGTGVGAQQVLAVGSRVAGVGNYKPGLTVLTNGNVGVSSAAPTAALDVGGDIKASGRLNLGTVLEYANNATALASGLVAGDVYRTGEVLKIVY